MVWFFDTNDGCCFLEGFLYEPLITTQSASRTQAKINQLLDSVYALNNIAEEIQDGIHQSYVHKFKDATQELLVSCFDMSFGDGKPRVDLLWSGFSWLAFRQLHKKSHQVTEACI